MTPNARLLRLCGIGFLTAGAVSLPAYSGAAAAASAAGRPAPKTTASDVRITAGPALDGRPIDLGLILPTGDADRSVADLLPPGMVYLPGTSRLRVGATTRAVPDPSTTVTTEGTLLRWSDLPVPGGAARTLVFAVRPTGRHRPSWSWLDRAVGVHGPAGAGTLAAGPPPAGSARRRIDVTPLWAAQTAVSHSTTAGHEDIVEKVSVRTGTVAPARTSKLDVYLPGVIKWAGCTVHTRCDPASVVQRRLPTQPGHGDLPLLGPGADRSGRTEVFTVLEWHLASLRPATSITWSYRIVATRTTRPRTEDLVLATAGPSHGAAAVTMATVQAWPGDTAAHPPLTRQVPGVGTSTPGDGAPATPSTAPPTTAPPQTATAGGPTGGSTTTRHPGSVGPAPDDPAPHDPVTSARTADVMTDVRDASKARDPFSSAQPASSASRSSSSAAATSTPKAVVRTAAASTGVPLASTGADIFGDSTTGVVLIGLGGALVVGTRRRRTVSGAHFRSNLPAPVIRGGPSSRSGIPSRSER